MKCATASKLSAKRQSHGRGGRRTAPGAQVGAPGDPRYFAVTAVWSSGTTGSHTALAAAPPRWIVTVAGL